MTMEDRRGVRIGCHTCRLRKMTCDKAKPECYNCTRVGRECAGYLVVEPGEQSIDRKKMRLLKAFREITLWKENARDGFLRDLSVATALLRSGLLTVMSHLKDSINILNDNTFDEDTLEKVVPNIQSLIIIQICHYDVPDFPSLHTQHRLTPNTAIDALGMVSSIENIEHASNSAILEAVQYIRSVVPGMRTDSSLAPNGPIISAHQEQICAPFDQCHTYSRDFIAYYRNYTRQPLSNRDRLSCMEAEMKYRTAKICVNVCHSSDESAYDRFKDLFEGVVLFANSILNSCPEALEYTNSEFDFDKSSYLPLLEFVILKCRSLVIRYDAWLILEKLAARKTKPVNLARIFTIGKRIIETEHRVQIEEVTQENSGLFPLPAEELRVRHCTTDERFEDLVTVQKVNREGLARVQRTYTQRLLLRCGSYELNHLAEWVERILFSSSETGSNLSLLDSHIQTAPVNHADALSPPSMSGSVSLHPSYDSYKLARHSKEQLDFILYHCDDCNLGWEEVAERYNETFHGGAGNGFGHSVAGIQRAHARIKQQERQRWEVRQGKDSVLIGLLHMQPERAITYSWVSEYHRQIEASLTQRRHAPG
ncbi:hypothetical protein LZ30DRAFT_103579 [Colletotrichum cereale]|nr:hypothetical protein LZ30DRAFT_103579 [Colletotrichum cereale]